MCGSWSSFGPVTVQFSLSRPWTQQWSLLQKKETNCLHRCFSLLHFMDLMTGAKKKKHRVFFTWPALIKELHNTLLRSGPCPVAQPFCRDSKSLTHSAPITTKNPFMNTLLCLYSVAASRDNQGKPKSCRICPFWHVAMIKRKQHWRHTSYSPFLQFPLWYLPDLSYNFHVRNRWVCTNVCVLIPLPPLCLACATSSFSQLFCRLCVVWVVSF